MAVTHQSPFRKPPSGGFVDLVTSDPTGWHALQFRVARMFSNEEEYETAPLQHHAVHIHLDEIPYQEHFLSGRWKAFRLENGVVSSTPSGQTRRMRFGAGRNQNAHTMMHVYLPQSTMLSVAAQLPAATLEQRHPDDLIPFLDQALHQSVLSLLSAHRAKAPNLYAETTALWLSAHLLLGLHKATVWKETFAADSITSKRLAHVMEYIESHLAEDLSLEVLAREAGLSPFSFVAGFRKAFGTSPRSHVQDLRMRTAATLLAKSKKSVHEIAYLCGFATPSHFGAIFRKHFKQTPREYRFGPDGMTLGR